MKRVIVIVLDGVGAGAASDASDYGDAGSNTLAHAIEQTGPVHLPELQKLGLGCLLKIKKVSPTDDPQGCWGLLEEQSKGKDSITGHWELSGLITETPFPTYPKGFPPEIIEPFQKKIGRRILGNKAASGTEILKELGSEHVRSGFPIVYTSVDSVFQIAAHEEVIPVQELYRICRTAREMLVPPHHLSRVIARPFTGKPGNYIRTPRRKDFSVDPTGETLFDAAQKRRLKTIGIGKTGDLFNYKGLDETLKTISDEDGLQKTLRTIKSHEDFSVIFTNLVDFDMKYGHRNDAAGFVRNLELFDRYLAQIRKEMLKEDLLFITADHGCDPTLLNSTDHTRERIPLFVTGEPVQVKKDLGLRRCFADVGQTAAAFLGLPPLSKGKSFLEEIL